MSVRRTRTAKLADVATLRLLADPLKLRIYEALRDAPSSPHELAARFRKRPTALYHHFARLAAAGLIEVATETRRRGAIERRYRPATRRPLVVDRALLRAPARAASVAAVVAASHAILQVTGEDVRQATLDATRPLADRARAEIATLAIRTTDAHARRLMKQLRALLAAALAVDGTGDHRVRLTLALVPAPARQRPSRRPASGYALRGTR